MSLCPGSMIAIHLSASKIGLAELVSNTIQIADSDVLAASNISSLVADHPIAIGIFAMIINPRVTGVSSLTIPQIQAIYSGKITNWRQVGGPNQSIYRLCRVSGSGTRETFDTHVLGSSFPPYLCDKKINTSDVLAKYLTTPGAIGYDILSTAQQYQQQGKLTIIDIDQQPPTLNAIASGSYPFWNVEHMYTLNNPPALAQAFIAYMSSPYAQTIMNNLDFLSINQVPNNLIRAHLALEGQ
jgi:phosphate transport system substrate-binding protein